ncbi:DUF1848 domain-containing protein [Thermoanaerobacter uzonensis]|uniref:DUF1848 domain-containing protein n=1 Tax=Thermoanaerobacter uzonensis TaxID=447593 RepID=UPI003D768D8A
MIISTSRRTDIPAFYSDWFFKRIEEGYVLVRNPFNFHQISKISLKKDAVDGIVFWTKNPEKMIPKLHLIEDYTYYFQFTLNPYDKKVERNVSEKSHIIEVFKKLSIKIGKERVIWRYDPIILTPEFDIEYHIKSFKEIMSKLYGYTSKCIISFVTFYPKVRKNLEKIGAYEINKEQKLEIAHRFYEIAKEHSIKLDICAEEMDLSPYGIEHARCIDPDLIGELSGKKLDVGKDKNQRKLCGCAESVDVGTYDTCLHGCIYCYANSNISSIKENVKQYDVNSPLLCSKLAENDVIKERGIKSYAISQTSIFDK